MNALRTVWRLSRYRLALFSATALLASAHTTLSLGPGLIFKEFFDALTGEAPVHFGVWTLVALYAAVKMVDMVATIGEEVFRALVVGYVRALLQWNLFGVILRSRPTRERYTSGDMLNRFDEDVDQIVHAVAWSSRSVGMVVALIIALVIMFRISPLVTILGLLPVIVLLYLTRPLGTRVQALWHDAREASGQTTGALGEMLGAVQAIKVADSESAAVRRFEAMSDDRRRAHMGAAVPATVLFAMNELSVVFATAVVLMVTAPLVHSESLTTGDLALFVTYLAGWPIAMLPEVLGFAVVELRETRVSIEAFDTARAGRGPGEPPGSRTSEALGRRALTRRRSRRDDRPRPLGGAGGIPSDLPAPGQRPRRRGRLSASQAGIVHRGHRAHRLGEDDSCGGAPWSAPQGRR